MSNAATKPSALPAPEEKVQFGLLRYGQGYWVRVLTAAMAGVIILSGALWAYKMLSAFDPPVVGWRLRVNNVASAPAVGSPVGLVTDAGGIADEVGTALVKSFEPIGSGGVLVVEKPSMKKDRLPSDASRVTLGGASATISDVVQPIPMFDKRFLQLGVASVILVVGFWFVYLYVGRKEKTVDFLVAVDGEMKKVNWSTKRTIRDSTIVVVGATFLIAAVLAIYDLGIGKLFGGLFKLLGVYQ